MKHEPKQPENTWQKVVNDLTVHSRADGSFEVKVAYINNDSPGFFTRFVMAEELLKVIHAHMKAAS